MCEIPYSTRIKQIVEVGFGEVKEIYQNPWTQRFEGINKFNNIRICAMYYLVN